MRRSRSWRRLRFLRWRLLRFVRMWARRWQSSYSVQVRYARVPASCDSNDGHYGEAAVSPAHGAGPRMLLAAVVADPPSGVVNPTMFGFARESSIDRRAM